MLAAWFERGGPAAEVLEVGRREQPQAGAGEVLVRVHASAVNPSDVKKRAGLQPAAPEPGWVIPHSDGAGVIEAVGEGVDETRVGQHVWLYEAQYQRRFGTAAEYVALPAERAAPLPPGIDFEIGACMGIPAMTAHRCVFADGDVAGQTVLVTGAGGRVGWYAVQWAKRAGARVIGTAGRKSTLEAARQAGADLVVDYAHESVADAVMAFTDGAGVDRIVDVEFGMNLGVTLAVLRRGGVVATYSSSRKPEPTLPFYPLMFRDVTVRFVLVYAMPESAKRAAIDDIGAALAAGDLAHRVAETYPLEEIARAHERIENGEVHGCVIVRIP